MLQKWAVFLIVIPLFLSAEPKKKLLILCSNGGNGHNAAAGALKAKLESEYDFKVVYPIDELQIWGVKSGESLYNLALKYGWTRSVNVVSRYLAPKVFRTYKNKMEGLITNHIEKEKPNLVISLIPFINYPASEAARKLNIPYLIITTDNDLQTWVHGLQGVSHRQFKVVVGTDLWCSREMLRKRNIPDTAIASLGLPIRPDFLVKRDPENLKSLYKIPQHKPVILIMIGGVGGETTKGYIKSLGTIQLGVHFIVCAGRNADLADDLKKMPLHPTNSMTVMGFTDKIPELMALSDLIITKSGTTSVTEALAMQIPILIDCTTPVISWEQANIDLIMHYGVGDFITHFNEAETIVRQFLYDSELRHQMRMSFQKIPKNRFNEEIGSLIQQMCNQPCQQ